MSIPADVERPPSVDSLARSLTSSGLPHAVCVEIARAAIDARDVASAPARAAAFRRSLLMPVINATGVLLHTNLGRSPVRHHQEASAQTVEFDLATGARGSRQRSVGQLFARLCGAEAAMVVNNNAAAVLLVLAALASGRDVPVSRGESVEIGGSFRVPDVMEQSGARLVDVGTTNRTRLADYRRAVDDPARDVAMVLKVHPSNYRVEGFVEDTPVRELATLGVAVVADLGSGLVDANCPWLPGPPPAWLAGEPAAVQTLADGAALVTFSGDKLLGGPQAGIIAGRADLVERCLAHPLARALRPGGLVLASLQDLALAYLGRSVTTDVPFWAMVATPLGDLERRAHRIVGEIADVLPSAVAMPMQALPGAGSAPGVTIPSYGVVVDGDLLVALRAHDLPVIARTRDGRTMIDLRAVDESDDAAVIAALRAGVVTVLATAGHVDHGKSSLVLALTGTDPDRFEEEKRRGLTIDLGFAHTTLPSGAELSFVDVPGHVKFLRNMLAGIGGLTGCVFVVAATEGWKPQSEEHLRILELLGVTNGIVAMTKVDLVDAEIAEIAALDIADHVAGTFLEDAPILGVSATAGTGMAELIDALDGLVADCAAPPDTGRPRLWIDRVFAAKGSGTVVTGTLVGGPLMVDQRVVIEPGAHEARVRGLQTAGRSVERIGPGHRVAVNLAGVDHGELARGHVVVEPDRWRLTDRFDASLHVLERLDHDVSRRGAYAAYVGSGEHPVKLRVLGSDSLVPGAGGAVRLFLPEALPLLPGDRFILRESGRDETVGGGEVLDIDPVLKASKANPDRTLDRVVRERGWVTVGELERLTGEVAEPTVGDWVATPEAVAAVGADIVRRVAESGPAGLDLAAFDDRERAVLATLDEVVVDAGRVRPADAVDPFADHPFLAALLAGGFTPPSTDGVDRADLRELIRRGHVVQRDNVCFHESTIGAAADVAAGLLARSPEGFTVAEFRDATGASRKFALPLVAELDARGITRRRDDLRIAGPRLP